MVVLWRVELSNTKPELSQGERAQYWDTCAAALAFVYCYTYEAYGMVVPFKSVYCPKTCESGFQHTCPVMMPPLRRDGLDAVLHTIVPIYAQLSGHQGRALPRRHIW